MLTKLLPNWPHLSFVNNDCFFGRKKIMGDIWYANIVKTTRHNFCIDFVMDFAPNGPKGLDMAIQGQKRPSLGRNHNVD